MSRLFTGERVILYHGAFGRGDDLVHQIRYTDNNGKKRRKIVPSDKDPIAWAKQMDIAINQSTETVIDDFSFGALYENYKDELQEQVKNFQTNGKYGEKLRPTTFKKKLIDYVKWILPYFKDEDIRTITPNKILKWQKWLRKNMKPQSANAKLGELRRCFSFFVVEGYILSNPCREIPNLIAEPPVQGYTPSQSEIFALIDAAHPRNFESQYEKNKMLWHYALLRLVADTGVRISEAIGLDWNSVRNDRIYIKAAAVDGYLFDETKTRHSERDIPIASSLVTVLKEHRLLTARSNNLVFTNEKGNLFRSTDVRKQVLIPACKRVGMPVIGWHGLRRAYITELFDRGKRDEHVQRLCGHAPGSKMTRGVYQKVRAEEVVKQENVIEYR